MIQIVTHLVTSIFCFCYLHMFHFWRLTSRFSFASCLLSFLPNVTITRGLDSILVECLDTDFLNVSGCRTHIGKLWGNAPYVPHPIPPTSERWIQIFQPLLPTIKYHRVVTAIMCCKMFNNLSSRGGKDGSLNHLQVSTAYIIDCGCFQGASWKSRDRPTSSLQCPCASWPPWAPAHGCHLHCVCHSLW